VTHGDVNASNYFQAVVAPLFDSVEENMLPFMDDFLTHCEDEDHLVQVIRAIFNVCRQKRLKLSALKTDAYLKEAHFCGRLISEDGVRFDPRRFDALKKMNTPTMAGELCQFLFAANWVRTSVPEYARIVAPLNALKESIYATAGKRTKRRVEKYPSPASGRRSTRRPSRS
jgi:hypothetical protein